MSTPSAPGNANSAQRRILLCAIGMSPQIVTETLYALAVNPAPGDAPWVPTEVHLVTTQLGEHNARLTLLSGQPGWFHQLRRDFKLPPIAFDDKHIHVVRDAQGTELDDIRSPADNEAAADQIAALVRDLTADGDSVLHASLAGGRKTMSYYLGYALSLFGRAQDQLSHVLVSSDYEAHPEFFYPTPYERVIHTREVHPRALDCRDAQVQLAPIPFLRLRGSQPARALEAGAVRFRDAVRRANLAMQPAVLQIDYAAQRVSVSGEPVDLTATSYALYAWLARRHKDGLEDFDSSDMLHAQAFLDFLKSRFGEMDEVRERMEGTTVGPNIRCQDQIAMKNSFAPMITRLNQQLAESLGESLARRCHVESHGKRGGKSYGLPEDLVVR